MKGATFQYDSIGGTVHAPSSKSYSQRMVLLSTISEHPVTLRGVSFCDDEVAAIELTRACGSKIQTDGDRVVIEPHFHCPAKVNVGESATLYRISMGMLSAMGCRTEFTGSPSLAGRPMGSLVNALTEAGVNFFLKDDGFYVMDARARKSVAIRMDQKVSSQFVSSLIFYNAVLGNSLPLITAADQVSASYIDITLHVLGMFGYAVSSEDGAFHFSNKRESGMDFHVEGDFSSSLFPVVLGGLCSAEGIRITGLEVGSRQADRIAMEALAKASSGISLEHRGDRLEIKASLSDFEFMEIDASLAPDSCPPISVVGIFSERGIRILNYERLQAKESDRVSAIKDMVMGYGALWGEGKKSLTIYRGSPVFPKEYYGKDHRMLMSSITAGLAANSHTRFFNLDVVRKSYPGYFDDLRSLGIVLNPI